MKGLPNWLKGLLGLAAPAALGLALAWLLRAALPQETAAPTPATFTPLPPVEATAALPIEAPDATPTGEMTKPPPGPTEAKPGPTSRPAVTVTLPVTTPTPIPATAGTIVYKVREPQYGRDVLYALPVDKRGNPTGPPQQIPGTPWGADYVGELYPSPDDRHIAIDVWVETGSGILILDVENEEIAPLIQEYNDEAPGVPGGFLAWHPDGQQVLYEAQGVAVWLVNIHTGQYVSLAEDIDATMGKPDGGDISPDGERVIFSASGGSGEPARVWKVDVDGTNLHPLFDLDDRRRVTGIKWSPDGSRVAYRESGVLYIMDGDGGNRQRLCSVATEQGFPFAWSPDGRIIAFVGSEPASPGDGPPEASGGGPLSGNVYLVDVATGEERVLIPNTTEGNIDPAWSPDGSRLMFVSTQTGATEVWAVNVDGTGLRQVTHDGAEKRYPVWLPR
jgi:Tol biopolymer transport system component